METIKSNLEVAHLKKIPGSFKFPRRPIDAGQKSNVRGAVDEMPSANGSGCRPILWFHADSTFQPRMTIPAELSSSLSFNLNLSATELDVFLKLFAKV
ncbi:hypothetical protein TNIN_450251 [Trichonephila inaurata madagascariensis]|uniref:Uncharacterized protein n=1 Tax=Trichonephila inaurata madagascariensis TaxID=2747483 RepID=A0A8X6Y559_9ARAC|nr:hypothetical protein TNIN_450251 [Trichonephila inaurata madagascariensis]